MSNLICSVIEYNPQNPQIWHNAKKIQKSQKGLDFMAKSILICAFCLSIIFIATSLFLLNSKPKHQISACNSFSIICN